MRCSRPTMSGGSLHLILLWLFRCTLLIKAIVPPPPHPASPCEAWQFQCRNGLCIAPNRFCDGNDDCGDSYDEPLGCSNCNQSLAGEAGIKYPIRITEPPPLQRHLPFACILNLVAGPGQRVEITFLSFQIGSLQIPNPKDPTSFTAATCRNGYLRLSETGDSGSQEDRFRSQQTRGFSQLISALKEPDSRKRLSTLFEDASGSMRPSEPIFGHFCGRLLPATASVSFFSSRNNVTAAVHLPPRTAVGSSQPFGLYLTYRFLPYSAVSPASPSDSLPTDRDMPLHFGKPVPKTYCDKTFVDCDRKLCLIRSPNFPGLFLRNFTCSFLVRQDRIPEGKVARIEVYQTNEYKIRVGAATLEASGRRVSDHDTGTRSAGLMSDCEHDDMVEIFDVKNKLDGGANSRFLITRFCGSGVLAPVTSSSPELEIVLTSRSDGALYASKLELMIRVHYYDASIAGSDLRLDQHRRCTLSVNGSSTRFGTVSSPTHTLPPNTVCKVHFSGARETDRIWLYFLSYFVRARGNMLDYIPGPETAVSDNCDVSSLEMYMENVLLNTTSAPDYRFCERTTPVMCTRAADYTDAVPEKPCLPPAESYLSSGSEALLTYSFFGSSDASPSNDASLFVLRYEFVDTEGSNWDNDFSEANEIPELQCGTKFQYEAGYAPSKGVIRSPGNVFQYGRGGRGDLSCRYQFHLRQDQKLTLSVKEFRTTFLNCRTEFDPLLRNWNCRFYTSNSLQKAYITISESIGSSSTILLGCICSNGSLSGSKTSAFFFESSMAYIDLPPRKSFRELEVVFTVTGMASFHDHTHFGFSADFLLLNVNSEESTQKCCIKATKNANTSGEVTLFAHGSRCRWVVSSSNLPRMRLRGTRCVNRPQMKNMPGYLLLYNEEDASDNKTGSIWVPQTAICNNPVAKSEIKYLEEFVEHRRTQENILSNKPFSRTSNGSTAEVSTKHFSKTNGSSNTVVLEITSAERFEAAIEWILHDQGDSLPVEDHEASQRLGAQAAEVSGPLRVNCRFRCPELNACINPELLCDGVAHCPATGYDEDPANCSVRPMVFYVAIATGVSLLVGALAASVAFLFVRGTLVLPCRRHRNRLQRNRSPEKTIKYPSVKQRSPTKCYATRQIQAVEVRYPIIHM